MGSFDTSSEDAARAAASQAYLAKNAEAYKAAAADPITDPRGAMMKIMSTKDTPITSASNTYGIPRLNNTFFRDPRNAAKNWKLGVGGEQVRVKFLFAARFVRAFELPAESKAQNGLKWEKNAISFLLKSIDKPEVKFTTEKLNQYNKKRVIQTKHEYGDCKIGLYNTYDDKALAMFLQYFQWYYGDPLQTDNKGAWLHDELNKEMNSAPLGYQIPKHVTATLPNGDQSKSAHDFFSHVEIFQFGNGLYTQFDLINPKFKDFDLDGDEDHHDKGQDVTEVKMTMEFEGIQWIAVGKPMTEMVGDIKDAMTSIGIVFSEAYDIDPKNPGSVPKGGTRRNVKQYGGPGSQSSLQKLLGLANAYNIYRNGGMNGIGLAGVILGAGRGSSALSPYGSQNFGSYGGYGAYGGMSQMPMMQVINTMGAFGSSTQGSYMQSTYQGAATGYGSYGIGGQGSTLGNILSTVGMLGSFGGTNNSGGYGSGYGGGMMGNGSYFPTGGVGASYDASGYGSGGNLSNAFTVAQSMSQMAGGNSSVASTFGALLALGSVTGSRSQNRADSNIEWDSGNNPSNDSSQGFGLQGGRAMGIGTSAIDVMSSVKDGVSYGVNAASSMASSGFNSVAGFFSGSDSPANTAIALENSSVSDEPTYTTAVDTYSEAFRQDQNTQMTLSETQPEINTSFVSDYDTGFA